MKKIKFLLCIIFAFLSLESISQETDKIPIRNSQKAFLATDFLSVKMPKSQYFGDEPNMDLVGLHYNLNFNNFYTGLGFYGSVGGIRGGFFTLGFNTGYVFNLSKKLLLDTGFHFGAGGGAGAPDGGGAFILPHVDLRYIFKKFSLSTGYSYIFFFDEGEIESHQLHLGLQIPFNMSFSNPKNYQLAFKTSDLKNTSWYRKPSDLSFLVNIDNLFARGKSQFTDGTSLDGRTIQLAGIEISKFINNSWFVFFRADGAFNGIPAGYMDLFIGGGFHQPIIKNNTSIEAKLGIGAGGGGGVDTEGGVLIYPNITLEQKLFDDLYLSINSGAMMSPNKHFESFTLGAGLKYYTHLNGIKSLDKNYTLSKFKLFEFITKQDIYFGAQRDINPTENLYQFSLQINYFVNKRLYLSGQTSFANFGNAGAYAEGIIGFGLRTNQIFKERINLFAQVLAGGAGGGQISTGQGFIIKPSAGINYKLSKQLSLRLASGYIKARGGKLSSIILNLGLNYRLSFLNSK